MIDREKIKEEVRIAVERRLNLLNGDLFDLRDETEGMTNEILFILDSMKVSN